jgi:hypothetical protein
LPHLKLKLMAYSRRYPITLNSVKEYFLSHYQYLSLEMSDKELQKWLDKRPKLKEKSIIQVTDSLSDYLLCIGTQVQE